MSAGTEDPNLGSLPISLQGNQIRLSLQRCYEFSVVVQTFLICNNRALRNTVSCLEAENKVLRQREEELLQYMNDAEILDELPLQDQWDGMGREEDSQA